MGEKKILLKMFFRIVRFRICRLVSSTMGTFGLADGLLKHVSTVSLKGHGDGKNRKWEKNIYFAHKSFEFPPKNFARNILQAILTF